VTSARSISSASPIQFLDARAAGVVELQAFVKLASRKRLFLSSFSKDFLGGFERFQWLKRRKLAIFAIREACKFVSPQRF
jgi:hypothetical protein